MATRYLVTRPSFVGDTFLLQGSTIDLDDDFVPSPHLTPVPAAGLLPDIVIYPAIPTIPVIPTIPPGVAAPTATFHKIKKK